MTPKSKNGWTARKRTTTLRERCNNCTRESLGLPSSCRDACFCRLLGLLDLLLGPVELDLGPAFGGPGRVGGRGPGNGA